MNTNFALKQLLWPLLMVMAVIVSLNLYQLPNQAAQDHLNQQGFSVDNVRDHLGVIARAPHPTGSDEIKVVRDYLLNTLRQLGGEAQVQQVDMAAVMFSAQLFARVENVVARFPGSNSKGSGSKDSGKALMLLSHYDSFDHANGASDDGYGVATILETLRVLLNKGPLDNDVIVVFSDAEERGTLGIKAFVEHHAYAKDVGLVINFEARGSSGPVRLFETSANNSALLAEFAKAAPFPIADSFFYSLYSIMGNYTDMTVTKNEGLPGLNLAFSEGFYDYHTMGDTVENIDNDSLVHAGTYALALTEHFANQSLPVIAATDEVFFNLSGNTFVHYPMALAYIPALLVLLGFMALLWIERRAGRVSIRQTLGSMLAVFLHLLLIVLLTNGLNGMLGGGPVAGFMGHWAYYALLSSPGFVLCALVLFVLAYHFGWVHLLARGCNGPALLFMSGVVIALAAFESALIPVVVALILVLISAMVFKRQFKPSDNPDSSDKALLRLFYGFIGLWTLLTVVTVILMPGLNHIFAWPLLPVLLCRFWAIRQPQWTEGLATLGALLAVVWWSSYVPLVYSAVGDMAPGIPLFFVALTAGLFTQVTGKLMQLFKGLPALVLVGVSVSLLTGLLVNHQFDQRFKQPTEVFYLADQLAGETHWGSFDVELHPWLQSRFGDSPQEGDISRLYPGVKSKKMQLAQAPHNEVKAIVVEPLTNQSSDNDNESAKNRQVSFRLTPSHLKPDASAVFVNLFIADPHNISAASVNGEPVALLPEPEPDAEQPDAEKTEPTEPVTKWWRWQYYGLPATGAEVVLSLKTNKPVTLRITEIRAGLPAEVANLPDQRPDNSMSKSYGYFNDSFSDSTVIITEHQL